MKVLSVYQSLARYPLGKKLFSILFSFKAPYFRTINATVKDLQPGLAVVSMKQRWGVENHIKTVHAIACCNLVEMAMGLLAEATIPSHLRWLPMGMEVNYTKKATGELTAVTTVDPQSFFVLPQYPGEVVVPVEVKNKDGVVVTTAGVKLWISEKPKKV